MGQEKLFFFVLFLLGGFDDLLGVLRGNFLVSFKAHGEGAAALRHGTKVGGILEHFALGNFGGYALGAVYLVHTHDAAAALIDVADDVAHVLVGDGDFYVIDGLKEDGAGLIELLEREAGSGLERHFRGVNRVVGTVVQFRGQAYYREAGENALLDVVAKALFNGGDKVARYYAADNGIFEDELGIGGIVVGTELDNNVTELAVSAGLLLMASAYVDLLADGLTVRNFGILKDALYAELGCKLLRGNFDVEFAETGEQGLGGLNILGDGEGRVFFDQTVESGEDLVFFAGLLGVYGHRDAGSREVDVSKLDGLGSIAQGVTGGYGAELGEGADVTSDNLGGGVGLLAEHEVNGAGLFSLFGVGVVEVGFGRKNAGIDLDKRKLTNEGVSQGLEYLSGEGLVILGDALFLVAGLGIYTLKNLVGGRRHEVNDEVEQHIDADTVEGVEAYNGNDAAVGDTLAQTEHGVFGRKFHFFEELFHELFISAGCGFHERLFVAFDGGFYVCGAGNFLKGLAFAHIGFTVENGSNADKLALFNDRNNDGRYMAAVLGSDGFQRLFEVGVFTGHVVDNDHAGRVVLVALGPGFFRAYIQTANSAYGDQGAFAYAQRAHHFAGKIEEAGNIYKVNLGFLILQRRERGGDGNLTANLFRIVVGRRSSVFNAALTVDRAGSEKHGFYQRGLTFAAVTKYGDITNVLSLIVLH